jgi:enoyl-CoA hydratase/carnithine racemase
MPPIIYEKKGRVAYITLNRPEALNSLNTEAMNLLTKAWLDVRDDPEVWIAIVTGTGERAFSAGADLKEIAEATAQAEREGRAATYPSGWLGDIPMRGIKVWKPFIAAINGIATGGGLELAMTCDIRIASETARLGLREVTQAIIPGAGGTQRLPRLVPFGIALEILMTGDFIDAKEAYRIGLVNKVVPPAELMSTAEALANRICENGPLAVKAVKEAAYRGIEMPLDEGLRLETLETGEVMGTWDAKEGPKAFGEKRKPQYQGK